MQNYLYNLATDKYRGLIPNLVKLFLFILSLIYGLTVRILIFISYIKPCQLNCKVISIGNITLGGTGKTSLVEFIARYLKRQGRKVAILSRGYKRKVTRYESGVRSYEKMGDEAHMLQMNLKDIPVIVDVDRIRAAKRAIRNSDIDTVILDDGFQQWKIKKDLEIVTIDATDPFGNQHLIPRGILREPLSSLKRAGMLVLTKTNLNPDIQDIKDFLSQINPKAPIFESIHLPLGFYRLGKSQELLKPQDLKGKTVTLISGIGDPDSFENLIASIGINVGLAFRFPDHYNYSQKDLEKIFEAAQEKNIDMLITTEKDAARLGSLQLIMLSSLQFLVLRIELKLIQNEEGFYRRLLGLYNS